MQVDWWLQLESCVRPHLLAYAADIKSTHAAPLWLGWGVLNKCVVHLHLHLYLQILRRNSHWTTSRYCRGTVELFLNDECIVLLRAYVSVCLLNEVVEWNGSDRSNLIDISKIKDTRYFETRSGYVCQTALETRRAPINRRLLLHMLVVSFVFIWCICSFS